MTEWMSDAEWLEHEGASHVMLPAECSVEEGRDRELSSLPYREYLKTDHWQFLRRRLLDRAGRTCRCCYAENVLLDVHHLSYGRLGREPESDLVVICRPCHKMVHEALDIFGKKAMNNGPVAFLRYIRGLRRDGW